MRFGWLKTVGLVSKVRHRPPASTQANAGTRSRPSCFKHYLRWMDPPARRSRGRGKSLRQLHLWEVAARLDDLTIDDHNQVMTRVGIAHLKAHLSEHLRWVRGGRTITVVDRDTPVARIIPYGVTAALEVRRATRRPGDLQLPAPLETATDSLAVLLEDRASR